MHARAIRLVPSSCPVAIVIIIVVVVVVVIHISSIIIRQHGSVRQSTIWRCKMLSGVTCSGYLDLSSSMRMPLLAPNLCAAYGVHVIAHVIVVVVVVVVVVVFVVVVLLLLLLWPGLLSFEAQDGSTPQHKPRPARKSAI
jgi:hypothetical protein